jgi:hypothetical protein
MNPRDHLRFLKNIAGPSHDHQRPHVGGGSRLVVGARVTGPKNRFNPGTVITCYTFLQIGGNRNKILENKLFLTFGVKRQLSCGLYIFVNSIKLGNIP